MSNAIDLHGASAGASVAALPPETAALPLTAMREAARESLALDCASTVERLLARHVLALAAALERAESAIRDHNAGMQAACQARRQRGCAADFSPGYRCHDCPADDAIDYPCDATGAAPLEETR